LAATNKAGGEEEDTGAAQAKEEEPEHQQQREASPAKEMPSAYRESQVAAAAEAKAPEPQAVAPAKAEPSPMKAEEKNDGGVAEPKSMRPTTARRRPPKVKENAATVVKEAPVSQAEKNTNIMKEGDDDDDFFNDGDEDKDEMGGDAKRVSTTDMEGKTMGKLVRNIVAEQEEEKREREGKGGNAAVDDGKKGIRLNLNIKKSVGDTGLSATDMEALLQAVQRLVTSTAPLGKCMDFVQEDLSQMSREGERWIGEYRKKIDVYEEARKRTEEELNPLRAQLQELDVEVKRETDVIEGVKRNIFKNEARIKQLLRSVATN
jgi:hypothetical protein